jgi:hypothetical protein
LVPLALREGLAWRRSCQQVRLLAGFVKRPTKVVAQLFTLLERRFSIGSREHRSRLEILLVISAVGFWQ